MYNTSQKLVAEFLGTFALVFFSAGAICTERFLQGAGGGLLATALASGLAIAVMSIAFSHVSGAHFNPAVTIGFWITKRMSTMEVLGYWIAQMLGGIVAAFCLKAMLPREDAWQPALGGTPDLVRDFTRLPAMGLEALITFFLVLIYFATTSEDNIGCRSVHRGCTQPRARVRTCPSQHSLVKSGRVLGRPHCRRLRGRADLRCAVR